MTFASRPLNSLHGLGDHSTKCPYWHLPRCSCLKISHIQSKMYQIWILEAFWHMPVLALFRVITWTVKYCKQTLTTSVLKFSGIFEKLGFLIVRSE